MARFMVSRNFLFLIRDNAALLFGTDSYLNKCLFDIFLDYVNPVFLCRHYGRFV